tara:strand:- start:319 stop:534 length:216 start_codon:yes stop_codon:yes gene_type:complete
MKVALFMILCSSVAGNCLEPIKINSYNTFYDCMGAGYLESYNKNKQIGPDDVNQYKMYIKFICANEEAEEI